ncbi:hypothetical protein SD70_04090 [Gordoniibacillus kamchatkensis]|uniref:Uncharacterized protein n=1 Tax=Gordoniibacillus kamchatkensis TaxID=1590651 RepID=A0ABR5ALK9_9BACL|nr:hypothetical protein [Paenibacillus sp. VKM B-2647]KIL41812.1 hypothetical protein SD70_04090 [Paenibacillus sp. VKM B-2647]
MQPWIEKLNAELGLPIRFDSQEYSQFRNCRGTFLLLDHALRHAGEAAAARDHKTAAAAASTEP